MDDNLKKLLREGKRAFDEYANEPRIEANSFMEEVLLVLGDYFVGNFQLKENTIICTFANGQVIELTAKTEE